MWMTDIYIEWHAHLHSFNRFHLIATRHCNAHIQEYAAQLDLTEVVHSVDEVRRCYNTALLSSTSNNNALHNYEQITGEIVFVSNMTVSQKEKQNLEKIRAMAYEAAYG